MAIQLVSTEDPQFNSVFTFRANGLEITATSDLETGDEIVLNLEAPGAWEMLYRGGSDYNTGQIVLRRII